MREFRARGIGKAYARLGFSYINLNEPIKLAKPIKWTKAENPREGLDIRWTGCLTTREEAMIKKITFQDRILYTEDVES
jgi:hypothetical protein